MVLTNEVPARIVVVGLVVVVVVAAVAVVVVVLESVRGRSGW